LDAARLATFGGDTAVDPGVAGFDGCSDSEWASALAAPTSGAVISKSVSAGQPKLKIKAKGKKRKKLNTTGKVKVNFAITYTPTGGSATPSQ
jgi:hypothetical protein